MNAINTLIVDDEALARRGLQLRLEKHEDVNIVGECANGREALKAIPELDPDLVFLDIQMPGVDGFEVVRQLQGDDMPLVVFATAFDQYAVKAFDVHAIDYIQAGGRGTPGACPATGKGTADTEERCQ